MKNNNYSSRTLKFNKKKLPKGILSSAAQNQTRKKKCQQY